ncbi:MAG TPA: hypothetical protein VJ648_07905 [Vicinamibacteria bacterium]|nr:hypothetical protein [Vicinamibacteria bacterium]
MLLFFATLLVSTADVPAAHGASCVVRALERLADAPKVLVADGSAHREDRAASRRAHAPVSPPATRFAFSPQLLAHALYTPPALGPRAQASTPSSQRDPPDSLA